MNTSTLEGLLVTIDALAWADRQVSRIPLVGGIKKRAAGVLLDTLFGPAEDFDYVSTTTAPSSPPPTAP